MQAFNRTVRNFIADESGTTAIEYAIIASGIAGAIIVTVGTLGSSVSNMWTTVKDAFN
jgi:pilus assembly protein Flp/PilA